MSDDRAAADRQVVQCNYTTAVSAVAAGARAYLVRPNPGGGDDRIVILVRSRGGRWIEKWENIRRLGNFRCKTLPPEHPLYSDERIWDYDSGAMAARLAAWARIQLVTEGCPSGGTLASRTTPAAPTGRRCTRPGPAPSRWTARSASRACPTATGPPGR